MEKKTTIKLCMSLYLAGMCSINKRVKKKKELNSHFPGEQAVGGCISGAGVGAHPSSDSNMPSYHHVASLRGTNYHH